MSFEAEQNDSTGIEDSLDRPSGSRPVTSLFTRPLAQPSTTTSYAFSITPNYSLASFPQQPRNLARRPAPVEPSHAAPSSAPYALPPRIQRPTQRVPQPIHGPPFALTTGSSAGLFGQSVASGAAPEIGASHVDASGSISASFSFAPSRGLEMLSMPQPSRPGSPSRTAVHQLTTPFEGAPHRLSGPTVAPTIAASSASHTFNPPNQPQMLFTPGANLDTAALAVEQSIRQQRIASRSTNEEDSQSRRGVSFSTRIPTNHDAATFTPNQGDGPRYGAPQPPLPPPPHRGISQSRAIPASDNSMSYLGQAPPPRTMRPSYRDASISYSTDASLSRPIPATRLFANHHSQLPHTAASMSSQDLFATPPHAAASDPARRSSESISYSFDPSTSASVSASASASASLSIPEAAQRVRLRKWDGTPTTVPAWLVSGSAEMAVDEVFEYDLVSRFDVAKLIKHHSEGINGQAQEFGDDENQKERESNESKELQSGKGENEMEDVDVLKSILEVQLGLKGLHGWYGHTYRNPRSSQRRSEHISSTNKSEEHQQQQQQQQQGDGRTSRKRRRRDSSTSTSTSTSSCLPPPPAASSPARTASPQSVIDNHYHGQANNFTQSQEDAEDDDDDDDEDDEDQEQNVPIVIYDTFGRARGTIVLPNYTSRGGPCFPLPNPRETFAIRHTAASALMLQSGTMLAAKETRLMQQVDLIKQRYRELESSSNSSSFSSSLNGRTTRLKSERLYSKLKAKRKALDDFRAKQRKSNRKGLQNALLESSTFSSRRF